MSKIAKSPRQLSHILTELGFAVETVDSAESATSMLSSGTPWNLFLIDWILPGMTGTELIEVIRSGPHASLPIMMVTGNNELEHVSEALAAGASEYVMKPFTRAVIAEKLLLLGFDNLH